MGFAAKFLGTCAVCRQPIEVGQEIEFARGMVDRVAIHTACHHLPVVRNQSEYTRAASKLSREQMTELVSAAINRADPNWDLAEAREWASYINLPQNQNPSKHAGCVIHSLAKQALGPYQNLQSHDVVWRVAVADLYTALGGAH